MSVNIFITDFKLLTVPNDETALLKRRRFQNITGPAGARVEN
jgi:hypothetical protein